MIGTESVSAFWKSFSIVLLSSCVALAAPNSAIVSCGWARCSPAMASSTGCTRSSALSALPFMSNSINCAWRSVEICPAAPVRRFLTSARPRRVEATEETAERNCRSDVVSVPDLTNTLSAAGVLKPALASIRSARAVSPVPCSESDSLCVPTIWPSTTATATNTSQIAVAFFQFRALHRPARAARFTGFMGNLLDSVAAPPVPKRLGGDAEPSTTTSQWGPHPICMARWH